MGRLSGRRVGVVEDVSGVGVGGGSRETEVRGVYLAGGRRRIIVWED